MANHSIGRRAVAGRPTESVPDRLQPNSGKTAKSREVAGSLSFGRIRGRRGLAADSQTTAPGTLT